MGLRQEVMDILESFIERDALEALEERSSGAANLTLVPRLGEPPRTDPRLVELKYCQGKRREARKEAREAQKEFDFIKRFIAQSPSLPPRYWLPESHRDLLKAQQNAHMRKVRVRRAHEAWLEVVRERY